MSLETPTYPGINLDANEGPQLEIVSIAFISLTIFTIAIRSFSRWYTKITLGLDDLLILIAAILSLAYTAIIIVEVQDNFYGKHIGKSDEDHLEAYMKGLYLLIIIYPVALSMSKLSLLALYWRLFAFTGGRIPIILAGVVNVAWCIAVLFAGIFSCHPIRSFWDPTVPSKCINTAVLFTSNEGFTIVFDIVVLLIPVWFVAQIKKSVRERISISGTFFLGLAVTVVSAIRLWRLVVAQRLPGIDPTFNAIDAGLWAVIELNLWILVASIPTFRPLLGKILRDHSANKNFANVSDGGSASLSGSGVSSGHHLENIKPGTTGTFLQEPQRDLHLNMEFEFGLGDFMGGVGLREGEGDSMGGVGLREGEGGGNCNREKEKLSTNEGSGGYRGAEGRC